jgi:hypothetical protein
VSGLNLHSYPCLPSVACTRYTVKSVASPVGPLPLPPQASRAVAKHPASPSSTAPYWLLLMCAQPPTINLPVPTTKHSSALKRLRGPKSTMATNSRPVHIQPHLFFSFFSARTTATATATVTTISSRSLPLFQRLTSIVYSSAPYPPSP